MRALTGLTVALLIVAGCAKQPEPTATTTEPKTEEATLKEASWPKDVTIHKNAKGDVECPVMHTSVASPEAAVGFQDYKGTRYYFCCGGCPDKFKAEPAKYAKS